MAFRGTKIACPEILDTCHAPNIPIDPELREMARKKVQQFREEMKNKKGKKTMINELEDKDGQISEVESMRAETPISSEILKRNGES